MCDKREKRCSCSVGGGAFECQCLISLSRGLLFRATVDQDVLFVTQIWNRSKNHNAYFKCASLESRSCLLDFASILTSQAHTVLAIKNMCAMYMREVQIFIWEQHSVSTFFTRLFTSLQLLVDLQVPKCYYCAWKNVTIWIS